MKISTRPVQEADLPVIGKLMTAYKISTSINRLLWKTWPNQARQQEQTLDSVRRSFDDLTAQLVKAVDEEGEILGFLVLTRKAPTPSPTPAMTATGGEGKEDVIEVPERFNANVFTGVIRAMGEIGKETDGLDRLEIEALAVREDKYRQGIGSKLLDVAFKRSRWEVLPLVMRSEPASHAFFDKLGFKEVKRVDLDLAEWASDPVSGYGVFRLMGWIWYPPMSE